MTIIDEILPKVKAEVRLDKANKTLWIKTDTLDGYGRVIIEDGSNWCRVFYEDKTEPSNSEIPNNCEDLQDWKDQMWTEAVEDEPTISKMEQVEEPQMGDAKPIPLSNRVTHIKDEPQTDCAWRRDDG